MGNKSESAFPFHEKKYDTTVINNEGLTKLEYFSAVAMQGLLSNPGYVDYFSGNTKLPVSDAVAELSIEIAHSILNKL